MPFANNCVDAGYSTLRDVPEVTIDQCATGSAQLTLRWPNGSVIDLTQYDIGDSSSESSSSALVNGVRIVVKEMPSDDLIWAQQDADVIDAQNGVISFDYSPSNKFTLRSGIFTAEAQVWQAGVIRKIYPFFLVVNPSLSSYAQENNQNLSIAEIRMSMRDVDPEGNFLLDELDFKTNEIALMIRKAVDYWNEVPPPIQTYKATNFPFRYHLSVGVVGLLHQMAAMYKMRNNLDYNAGGVTVADTIKWQQYENIGTRLWDEYRKWVRDKKYQLNIEGGFMTLNSGYYRGYFWFNYYRS
jgi:hypothetical protein